jgi:hypothetical protein
MKSIKMLGLSLVAALAAMAVIGAGSASATALCKVTSEPCGAGNTYPAGTQVNANTLATGTTALISWNSPSLHRIECGEGKWQFTSNAVQGFPLTGQTLWSFQACSYKTTFSSSSCLLSTTAIAPAPASLNNITGTRNGKGTVSGEPFKLKWSCSTPIAQQCQYSAAVGSPLFELVGGNPATVKAAVHMKGEPTGYSCPAEIDLSATFTVTTPNPIYVSSKV